MGKFANELQRYGRKLRKLRMARQVSQMDLEVMADLSLGSISRMENCRINPTKETLFRIASVLRLTPAETIDLFCITENLTATSPAYGAPGLRMLK